MQAKTFQGLLVWEKGHHFVLEIYKVTREFPLEEKFGLAGQMRRSAVSICANLAEGYKKSRKDFLRFIKIAEGSLEETKYHLILSRDLVYCNEIQFNALFDRANEIGKMLHGLHQKLSC